MARCELLSDVRVLDLTTCRAEMAGRLLADLGAEVIKVEPPGGAESRALPPFDHNNGESLYWAALGLGKRSIVLDLEDAAARTTLLELASAADVLIESFDPGWLDSRGLGYERLSSLNPALVYVSVTPYGATGPKAHWPATDLTIEAASGRLSLQGDTDRPPLPIGYPQASFHAGLQAATDAIIALNERALSGLGQRLDTSMQAAMVWTLMDATGYPTMLGTDPPGSGDERGQPGLGGRPGAAPLQPCRDGYVTAALGPMQVERLAAAIAEGEGEEPSEGESAVELAQRKVRAFFAASTKRELMAWAWKNDVRLAPVNTTADLLSDPQLAARHYWTAIGGRVHAGPFALLSRTPILLEDPAPALGADKGALAQMLSRPRRPHVPNTADVARPGEAFAGVKVADFSWVAAGPITAKALADHGATVVRVESATRPDILRALPPFKDGQAGPNRSQWLANVNTSKLGLTLNLATEGGREVARKLIDWADVVVESFTPGTMKRFGLDYEALSASRDDLIMLSTCLLGQTGPQATYGGYGNHGAAIAGFHAITGWPDRAPYGPSGPYTDVIAPRFAVPVLAAALLERRRSGLGQHIDLSQVEASIRLIEPLILDQSVNGRTAPAAGHGSATACPNGVYPVAGTQRYIAISVETALEWRALAALAPLAAFDGAQFASLEARRGSAEAIDSALAEWTARQEGPALEARLVAAGVPAALVQRATDLYGDPQLEHRDFFVTLEHTEVGPTPYDGLVTRFSAKRVQMHKAAPCVGEDTEFVLKELLGLAAEEIAAYAAAGALA